MKATGVVRKVDDLGRVVVPAEVRRVLAINVGDPVEFYTDGESIIIKKLNAAGDMDQVLAELESTSQLGSSVLTPEERASR